MAEEVKEYLDYDGLDYYDEKVKALFQDLTIEEVEQAFNELDESDPSYSVFYDIINKAKEATSNADSKAAAAVTATNNANTATSNADKATERANKAAEKLEVVNDITTDINLLRYTRDFIEGSTIWGKSSYKKDGIHFAGSSIWSKDTDSEGYANIIYTCTDDSQAYTINGTFVYDHNLSLGNEFTLSFEIMAESDIPITALNSGAIAITKRNKATNADGKTFVNVNLSTTGATSISNFEYDKWHKVVASFVINEPFSSDEGLRITCGARNAGHIRFRKIKLESGRINNPVWTASPFDVVQNYVQEVDITSELSLSNSDWTISLATFYPIMGRFCQYYLALRANKDIPSGTFVNFGLSMPEKYRPRKKLGAANAYGLAEMQIDGATSFRMLAEIKNGTAMGLSFVGVLYNPLPTD